MPVTGAMPSPGPKHKDLSQIFVETKDGPRESLRDILNRAKRARAELDARIADADMSDVAHLPAVTGYQPTPGKPRRKRKKTVAPLGMPAIPDAAWLEKMSGAVTASATGAKRKRRPIGAKLPKGPRLNPKAGARAPSAVPAPA